MHRYNKSLNPQIKRGKWEKEEDDVSICEVIFQCPLSSVFQRAAA
jgi:hypothetical protein